MAGRLSAGPIGCRYRGVWGGYERLRDGWIAGIAAPFDQFHRPEGRDRSARQLLGDHRLVTVTGPGGAGKTRLASEVARLVAAGFADGAFLVELAGVTDPSLVALTVAAAVGVQQIPGRRRGRLWQMPWLASRCCWGGR